MLNERRIRELRTMPYEEYLKTPEWIQKREQTLERDGHRCRACDSNENLNVHHRTYIRRGNEDLNDLTTFCESCHKHFHRKMSQMEIMERTHPEITDGDVSARKEKQTQQWEDHIIGMLMQNPSLYEHINDILSESDFTNTDASVLYQLLGSTSGQPFEQCVPLNLEPTVSRVVELVKTDPPLTEYRQKKVIIDLASRYKQVRLSQLFRDVRKIWEEVANTGDAVAERQLLLQMQEINRKMQENSAISRLKG